jgi:hypothetical protein
LQRRLLLQLQMLLLAPAAVALVLATGVLLPTGTFARSRAAAAPMTPHSSKLALCNAGLHHAAQQAVHLPLL